MFLPTTKEELIKLGWTSLDVILVTGDAYIDSPFSGVAVIGKVLLDAGFRVGVIGQPDVGSSKDILRLGTPRLFWGITGGCIDSMVANRTASKKKRMTDDYTPGGVNDKRPDRALIAYSNLVRRFGGDGKCRIVLGGIEASLRRVAHYDCWTDSVRRSILFDAKADYLLYGMAERSVVELARALDANQDPRGTRGLTYISKEAPADAVALSSFEDVQRDKKEFARSFLLFSANNDPKTAKTLSQAHGNRFLVQNPPSIYPTQGELDAIYGLFYERDAHPYYLKDGPIKALETIRFAVSTHRGCYGECSFCAIAVHEGRAIRSRSVGSIVKEVREITRHPLFKGRITDVGGPSANMYSSTCARMESSGACANKSCVSPKVCTALRPGHGEQIKLLREIRKIEGVKKAIVASGIRHDLVLSDKEHGKEYLKEIVAHHVSGQLKIAPEHSEKKVLRHMGKEACTKEALMAFKDLFYKFTKEAGLDQYLSYYLMAAHPGCDVKDMMGLKEFFLKEIGGLPEQVQLFTPTPSTYSTLEYYIEQDPKTGEKVFVEKGDRPRAEQKEIITGRLRRDHKGRGKRGK